MAKWRAIHKDISTSGQVIRLSIFGQLLFERMIIHADDWGTITGDPLELKAKTMPTVDNDLQEFKDMLEQMERLGLIRRYQIDENNPLIWILTFDDHQPAAVIGKRSDPKHPLHPDDRRFVENPRNSTKSDEKAVLDKTRQDKNRIEKKRIEQTTSDKKNPADVDDASPNLLFESNLSILSEMGVAEPTASECARYPHVNPQYLESLIEEMGTSAARGKKLGQGWLVTQIRNRRPPQWR